MSLLSACKQPRLLQDCAGWLVRAFAAHIFEIKVPKSHEMLKCFQEEIIAFLLWQNLSKATCITYCFSF